MAKQKKLVAKFAIDVDVPFYSYSSRKKNRKALSQIKRALKESLEKNGYITLAIDQDGPGGDLICDATDFIKVSVSSIDWALS